MEIKYLCPECKMEIETVDVQTTIHYNLYQEDFEEVSAMVDSAITNADMNSTNCPECGNVIDIKNIEVKVNE